MHRVSGLRKETMKNNKNEIIGHVDALDTTESCLPEKDEKSYVAWFMSTTWSSGIALAGNFVLCTGHA